VNVKFCMPSGCEEVEAAPESDIWEPAGTVGCGVVIFACGAGGWIVMVTVEGWLEPNLSVTIREKVTCPLMLGTVANTVGLFVVSETFVGDAAQVTVVGGVTTGGVTTGGVMTGGVTTGGVTTGGVMIGGVTTGGAMTGGLMTGGVPTGGVTTGGVTTGGVTTCGVATGGVPGGVGVGVPGVGCGGIINSPCWNAISVFRLHQRPVI